jgi:hypothetical protein
VWLRELAACAGPGSVSHVGTPFEHSVHDVTMSGADEAWQAYLLEEEALGDGSRMLRLETVVRVGNAVYVEVASYPTNPDDIVVSRHVDAEAASVATYVPTLAVFAA